MSKEKKQAVDQINDDRRKVVRNLLTGAGVTAGVGVVANSAWMEPVINTVMLPAHAQTSMVSLPSGCCPYYFDASQNWCYDDLGMQNGNSGMIGSFSYLNWVQPPNCPTPNN